MAKKELTPEQEALINPIMDTINALEAKIKDKVLDAQEKLKYKHVIKILKNQIKEIKANK